MWYVFCQILLLCVSSDADGKNHLPGVMYPAEPQLPTAHPLVWQIPDVHEEEEFTAYMKEVFLEAEVFIVDIFQFPCLHQQFNFHVEKVFQVPDY